MALSALHEKLDQLVFKDQQEYCDDPNIPIKERIEMIEMLNRFNQRFGTNRKTIYDLERLIRQLPKEKQNQPIKILDLGMGTGGLLEAIHFWAKQKNIPVDLYGMDFSKDFVNYVKKKLTDKGIPVNVFQGDAAYFSDVPDNTFDFVISTQMVHHIRTPERVTSFLKEIYRISRCGWLIVDINRRILGPVVVGMTGYLFGSRGKIWVDAIRSARRAYREKEINSFINDIQKKTNLTGMQCKAVPFLFFWKIMGLKP